MFGSLERFHRFLIEHYAGTTSPRCGFFRADPRRGFATIVSGRRRLRREPPRSPQQQRLGAVRKPMSSQRRRIKLPVWARALGSPQCPSWPWCGKKKEAETATVFRSRHLGRAGEKVMGLEEAVEGSMAGRGGAAGM